MSHAPTHGLPLAASLIATLVVASLLGPSAARERIEALRADARAALGGFTTARRLIELGDWVASRNH